MNSKKCTTNSHLLGMLFFKPFIFTGYSQLFIFYIITCDYYQCYYASLFVYGPSSAIIIIFKQCYRFIYNVFKQHYIINYCVRKIRWIYLQNEKSLFTRWNQFHCLHCLYNSRIIFHVNTLSRREGNHSALRHYDNRRTLLTSPWLLRDFEALLSILVYLLHDIRLFDRFSPQL